MREQTLKPGWSWARFGDVVKLNSDRYADPVAAGIERYVGLEHIEPEDLRIRRWGLVAEGTTFTNRFRPGQVLFGKRRAYQRKVAVADFEGVCSSDIYVFEPKDDRLLPTLLPFLCQTEAFYEHAVGTSAGSLSPRTNWAQLAGYEFALPPPEEQRRIAGVLSSTEKVLQAAHHLDFATLQLLDSLIEDQLRIANPLTQVELGNVAEIQYGLTVNQARRSTNRSVPYLRVANVFRGKIDLTEVKNIGLMPGDGTFQLMSGDVLVVEGHANSAELGRAAIWQDQLDDCLHENHLIRVRCGPELLPGFLTLYLNSSYGRSYFHSNAKSTSGLNTINSTVVRKMPVRMPIVLKQQEIVQTVDEIRHSVGSIDSRRKIAANIKRHMLAEISETQPVVIAGA